MYIVRKNIQLHLPFILDKQLLRRQTVVCNFYIRVIYINLFDRIHVVITMRDSFLFLQKLERINDKRSA